MDDIDVRSSRRRRIVLFTSLAVIMTVTTALGVWFVSWHRAEFKEVYGFHPDHGEELPLAQDAVNDELRQRCDAYFQAMSDRKDIQWPAWTLGAGISAFAMQGVIDEFNTKKQRTEEAISEAKQAFIHARTFAEDYGFEVRVPVCSDLRYRPMGIPR